jgi:hypothetical protein
MAAAAIPIATSVIGAIASKGLNSATSPGSGEQAGQQGALGAAGALSGAGARATGIGTDALSTGTNYYKSLLGTPQQVQAAVAPAERNISDAYGGATMAAKAGQIGVGRDLAIGGLGRERAGAISGLYQGVQPGAASALGGLGSTAMGQGIGAFTGAAGAGTAAAGQSAQSRLGGGYLGLEGGSKIGEFLSQGIKTGLKMAGSGGSPSGPPGAFSGTGSFW